MNKTPCSRENPLGSSNFQMRHPLGIQSGGRIIRELKSNCGETSSILRRRMSSMTYERPAATWTWADRVSWQLSSQSQSGLGQKKLSGKGDTRYDTSESELLKLMIRYGTLCVRRFLMHCFSICFSLPLAHFLSRAVLTVSSHHAREAKRV